MSRFLSFIFLIFFIALSYISFVAEPCDLMLEEEEPSCHSSLAKEEKKELSKDCCDENLGCATCPHLNYVSHTLFSVFQRLFLTPSFTKNSIGLDNICFYSKNNLDIFHPPKV